MRKKVYASEGIVLGKRDYSEADRIITIYTKDHGKISYIAKGVRKIKSRKRGSLDVFNHIKFSAAKGRTWDILTEVEIINSFDQIRKDLKKVAVAYFFTETIEKMTRDDEENIFLFGILLKYLHKLEISEKLRTLRKDFVYEVLVYLGFWPEGKELENFDQVLQTVLEKEVASIRIGKRMLED